MHWGPYGGGGSLAGPHLEVDPRLAMAEYYLGKGNVILQQVGAQGQDFQHGHLGGGEKGSAGFGGFDHRHEAHLRGGFVPPGHRGKGGVALEQHLGQDDFQGFAPEEHRGKGRAALEQHRGQDDLPEHRRLGGSAVPGVPGHQHHHAQEPPGHHGRAEQPRVAPEQYDEQRGGLLPPAPAPVISAPDSTTENVIRWNEYFRAAQQAGASQGKGFDPQLPGPQGGPGLQGGGGDSLPEGHLGLVPPNAAVVSQWSQLKTAFLISSLGKKHNIALGDSQEVATDKILNHDKKDKHFGPLLSAAIKGLDPEIIPAITWKERTAQLFTAIDKLG